MGWKCWQSERSVELEGSQAAAGGREPGGGQVPMGGGCHP